MSNIDWKLLVKQKGHLCDIARALTSQLKMDEYKVTNHSLQDQIDAINGVLNLLDSIQDESEGE